MPKQVFSRFTCIFLKKLPARRRVRQRAGIFWKFRGLLFVFRGDYLGLGAQAAAMFMRFIEN